MDIDLLVVPYDSARRGERMGAGPLAFLDARMRARLEQHGHRVRTIVIESRHDWPAEIGTAFELAAGIAMAVRDARTAGCFPLVLAGNCFTSLGVCAGLGAGAGVLWADAHGDFNTPETTIGGFLDGMALATLTGRCWTAMTKRLPGFSPIAEERVWLVGARDLDPLEAEVLRHSRVRRVPSESVDAALAPHIREELGDTVPLYVHLDLDVLDPSVGRANHFATPGGVSTEALAGLLGALRVHAPPAAVTVSAYDPAVDVGGRVRDAAMRIVDALLSDEQVVRAAADSPRPESGGNPAAAGGH